MQTSIAMASPPTADDQLRFLRHVQRLLSEGSFVATYKYALLRALADLAVTKGDDSGGPLTLSVPEIAETIIALYWRQAIPFPAAAGRNPRVLRQNTNANKPAEILTALIQARSQYGDSLARLQQASVYYPRLIRQVAAVVRKQPLWRLQTVGKQTLDFLYPRVGSGDSVTLRPGVAYCLRAFHDLIVELIHGAWLRHVRRFNTDVLGESADLTAFLFGGERADLAAYRPILIEFQDRRCFYCKRLLDTRGDVDHFIPWAKYAVDLGHNFVLAHAGCNASKAGHLAGEEYLGAWIARNRTMEPALSEQFARAGIVHNLRASERVAYWAYSNASQAGGQVWMGAGLAPLSPGWSTKFAGSIAL